MRLRRVRAVRDAGAYCSRECRFESMRRVSHEVDALRRIAKAVRKGAARAAVGERHRLASFVKRLNDKLKMVRRCGDCSSVFVQSTHLGRNELRCSACAEILARKRLKVHRRVAKAKRRAVQRGAAAERIDPFKVFARDKWRCHLCGVKTRPGLRGSFDALAPELDHIVSLADGGSHTWSNVACACRKCNAGKGSQSIGQLHLGIAA